jgi:hypothetical protein
VIDLDDANRPWFFQIPQQGIKDDRRFWETIKQRVRRLKLKNVKSVGAFTLLRPVGKKKSVCIGGHGDTCSVCTHKSPRHLLIIFVVHIGYFFAVLASCQSTSERRWTVLVIEMQLDSGA